MIELSNHHGILIHIMKTILVSFLLLGSLVAEELPIPEVKIDPMLSVKEQFSKARKKGWDFSEHKKKTEFQNKNESLFDLNPIELTYNPDQRSKSFRNDISEVERMKAIDRHNEKERNFKPPGKNKPR
jgi:hypothetical protein